MTFFGLRVENPSYSVELPGQFNMANDFVEFRFESPDASNCDARPSITINSTELGLNITGTDEGASSACSRFINEIADDGLVLIATDVPYNNLPGSLTVRMELSSR